MFDIFDYEEPVFRPPREWDSLIIQATVGCSRNTCAFCAMYKGKRFRTRSVEEISSALEAIPERAAATVQKIFIADGNAMCLPAAKLVELCAIFRSKFPGLRQMSLYANPLDVTAKSPAELEAIRKAGIRNVYLGIESGSDEVLRLMKKAGNYATAKKAMDMAHQAGFILSVTVLLGAGGKRYTKEHSAATAALVDETRPRFLNTLTTAVYEGTELAEMIKDGRFEVLTAAGTIDEHCDLIERIGADRIIYRSTHVSNMIAIEGTLKRDRDRLLETLRGFRDANSRDPLFNILKAGGRHEF